MILQIHVSIVSDYVFDYLNVMRVYIIYIILFYSLFYFYFSVIYFSY